MIYPRFESDYEYDEWEERQERKKLLDSYFGEDGEEVKDGN